VLTDDCDFLGGRLRLRQFRRGHRAGTDAVLLAAATRIRSGEHLVDVGAGVGAAALAVLCRLPDVTATLIEKDPATADLARHNVAANGFADRASVAVADLFDPATRRLHLATGADAVISNPPFYEAGSVRMATDGPKRGSYVLDQHTHADWFKGLASMLRPRGRLTMIHRPEALGALVGAAPGRIGALELRSIHPTPQHAAIRLLLSGTARSRAPLSILPPLALHGPDGRFTPEVEALHQGHVGL
jgi:tRNA1(Val) A37 N6-methylase TrmN6